MRVGIVGVVQIKWGSLTLADETSRGTKTSNDILKILVSMSRSWSMLTPVEAVIRRWPEAVTCRVDCSSRLDSTADKNTTAVSTAAWGTFTPPLQYETGSLFQKTNAPRYSPGPVIPSRTPQHHIDLQIHHQTQTPRKGPVRTFPLPSTVHEHWTMSCAQANISRREQTIEPCTV